MAKARLRYALRSLIAEVTEVFPDASYEVGDTNALGISHSVVFDQRASEWLKEFSDIIAADPRIEAITMLDGKIEYIIKDSNRIADDKSEFGIVGAADILGIDNPTLAYPEGEDVGTPEVEMSPGSFMVVDEAAVTEAGIFSVPAELNFDNVDWDEETGS